MKKNKKQYYSLVQNEEEKSAVLNIFGDITSFPWESVGEVSNFLLSKKLEDLSDVNIIDVYINSYGGEVAEGLAIYNALKRHKAKIVTHVDGFACSIASVIFMAGDERIMPSTSCLMIHNPWLYTAGNAQELRKQADDLDVIGECSINAYMEHCKITKEELKELLDNETWLSSSKANELGFATVVEKDDEEEKASQNVKKKIISMLLEQSEDEEEPKTDSENEEDNMISTENNDSDEEQVNTDSENQEDTNNSEEDNENKESIGEGEDNANTTDEESDKENGDENKEDDGSPSEQATQMVGAFFMNLEKEMLK